MKLSKEQISSISSLKLANRLDELEEGDLLEKYCDDLTDYVEKYSGIEADLKKACLTDDRESVRRLLAELAVTLEHLHADDLAAGCERLRDTFMDFDPEKLEAELVAFLACAASLSVDIQMELHRNEVKVTPPKTRKYQVIDASAPKSILAVDDIPITLNMLKNALSGTEYKFSGVTSAAAALDFIGKYTPDLFILDIEMPKMNGFELAVKIREAGHFAPIIFLTGNTTKEYLLKAVKAGAADFLVKPVNAVRIVAKVKKYLCF